MLAVSSSTSGKYNQIKSFRRRFVYFRWQITKIIIPTCRYIKSWFCYIV
nr:MAG TPA: hypothetical protein [Caudoviricetes sp.]